MYRKCTVIISNKPMDVLLLSVMNERTIIFVEDFTLLNIINSISSLSVYVRT